MPDIVHQFADTVRASVNMAYAALGVSKLNADKIVELEKRLRNIENQVEVLLQEYMQEKSRARGRAIAAGKWHAKAKRLQEVLDRVREQISGRGSS